MNRPGPDLAHSVHDSRNHAGGQTPAAGMRDTDDPGVGVGKQDRDAVRDQHGQGDSGGSGHESVHGQRPWRRHPVHDGYLPAVHLIHEDDPVSR